MCFQLLAMLMLMLCEAHELYFSSSILYYMLITILVCSIYIHKAPIVFIREENELRVRFLVVRNQMTDCSNILRQTQNMAKESSRFHWPPIVNENKFQWNIIE